MAILKIHTFNADYQKRYLFTRNKNLNNVIHIKTENDYLSYANAVDKGNVDGLFRNPVKIILRIDKRLSLFNISKYGL